jgi:hypothetical protein
MTAGQINIVQVAILIIAGPEHGQVDRAADIIGVSSPMLYRWLRGGNLQAARGAKVLRVHDLTGIPLELLLGAAGLPAGPGRTVRRITVQTERFLLCAARAAQPSCFEDGLCRRALSMKVSRFLPYAPC